MSAIADAIAKGQTNPDPDSEVPQAIRDEYFKKMKTNQSERVRRIPSTRSPDTAAAAVAAAGAHACKQSWQ